jgi:hypothetical protein
MIVSSGTMICSSIATGCSGATIRPAASGGRCQVWRGLERIHERLEQQAHQQVGKNPGFRCLRIFSGGPSESIGLSNLLKFEISYGSRCVSLRALARAAPGDLGSAHSRNMKGPPLLQTADIGWPVKRCLLGLARPQQCDGVKRRTVFVEPAHMLPTGSHDDVGAVGEPLCHIGLSLLTRASSADKTAHALPDRCSPHRTCEHAAAALLTACGARLRRQLAPSADHRAVLSTRRPCRPW